MWRRAGVLGSQTTGVGTRACTRPALQPEIAGEAGYVSVIGAVQWRDVVTFRDNVWPTRCLEPRRYLVYIEAVAVYFSHHLLSKR